MGLCLKVILNYICECTAGWLLEPNVASVNSWKLNLDSFTTFLSFFISWTVNKLLNQTRPALNVAFCSVMRVQPICTHGEDLRWASIHMLPWPLTSGDLMVRFIIQFDFIWGFVESLEGGGCTDTDPGLFKVSSSWCHSDVICTACMKRCYSVALWEM